VPALIDEQVDRRRMPPPTGSRDDAVSRRNCRLSPPQQTPLEHRWTGRLRPADVLAEWIEDSHDLALTSLTRAQRAELGIW